MRAIRMEGSSGNGGRFWGISGEPADSWGEHLIIKHRSDKERRKATVSKRVFQEKRRQVTSTSLVEGDCNEKEGGNMRGRWGWTVPLRGEEEAGLESLGRAEGLLAF